MNLPDNTGYVAAAYLVFLVLVLIYLAIMAAKLGRLEKQTGELLELTRRDEDEPAPAPAPNEAPV
jgi:hypothetical protein